MNILFSGTPGFGVLPLKFISEKFPVCGVLTGPDKKGGRGNKIIIPPVKQAAEALGLKVFQPPELDKDFMGLIAGMKPDILVVAAYSRIFREDFLKLFKLGGINLHPSLLPRFRGPSPVQAAILAGLKETGITIQKLALKMDAGDILSQVKLPLKGDETTEGLLQYTSEKGAGMLVDVLYDIEKGNVHSVKQEHDKATYCKLVKKENGCINWEDNAIYIERMIRAYKPWPGTYTSFNGLKLSILKAGIFKKGSDTECIADFKNKAPGYVLGMDRNHGILVKTGDGILYIEELQLQAKKVMNWKVFLNGNKNIIGAELGGE